LSCRQKFLIGFFGNVGGAFVPKSKQPRQSGDSRTRTRPRQCPSRPFGYDRVWRGVMVTRRFFVRGVRQRLLLVGHPAAASGGTSSGCFLWDIQRLLLVGYPAAASGGASSGSADLGGAQRPTTHGAIACHGVHAREEVQDEGAVPARRTLSSSTTSSTTSSATPRCSMLWLNRHRASFI